MGNKPWSVNHQPAPNDGTKHKCDKCGLPYSSAAAVVAHKNKTGIWRCKG